MHSTFRSRIQANGELRRPRRAILLGVLSIHDDALARDALTYTSFVARRARRVKKSLRGHPVTKLFHRWGQALGTHVSRGRTKFLLSVWLYSSALVLHPCITSNVNFPPCNIVGPWRGGGRHGRVARLGGAARSGVLHARSQRATLKTQQDNWIRASIASYQLAQYRGPTLLGVTLIL